LRMVEFLEDDDRARELFVLAVNFVTDIDAEARPPNVAFMEVDAFAYL
jgi:hypothetical protein